jgi:nucleotide-binding universal stress UspA family protein
MRVVHSIRHVMAASDLSGASMDAVAAAAALARKLDARMTLIHTFDPTPLGPAMAHISQPAKEAERRQRAAALARAELEKTRTVDLAGIDAVVAVIESESPALAMCDYADEHAVDLIVVGTQGIARLTRWLIGSVAEKVVRHARCSVLAVRPGARGPQRLPRRILVGTDFSPAAEPALDLAANGGALLGARVTLVYCYDASVPLLPALGAPDDLGSQDQQAKADLRLALESVARQKLAGVEHDTQLLVSRNAAASICSYADDREIGLIVVGAQGRTGHSRVLIGGVAEKVLRHASCSVLTVRPRR